MLTKVVVSGWLLNRTTEPLTNPTPLTVMTKPDDPATADDGCSMEMIGVVGEAMLILTELDALPPAFATDTLAEPGLAISAAGTAAVNVTASTNVVVRGTPFHSATESTPKPKPLMVRVNAAAPAATAAGLTAKTCSGDPMIVNEAEWDGIPAGFTAGGFITTT